MYNTNFYQFFFCGFIQLVEMAEADAEISPLPLDLEDTNNVPLPPRAAKRG